VRQPHRIDFLISSDQISVLQQDLLRNPPAMAAVASSEVIAELEVAVKDGSPERRSRMLQRIADLLVAGAGRLGPSQLRVFDDVLVRLIDRADARSLSQLSTILAGLAAPPEETIRVLASHENAAVAVPVLLRSPLPDAVVIELARYRSQQHLAAISGRPTLGEMLTDAVLKHAGRDVSRALARNNGARFSEAGYLLLVATAEHDDAVAEALGLRADLPPAMLNRLLSKATPTVRARLLKAAPPQSREKIQATINSIAGGADSAPIDADYARALTMVDGLNRVGKLNDSSVNRFAVRREHANVVAALSVLSGAAVETIKRLMEEPGSTGLIVASRASRLNWQTTLSILNNRNVPQLSKDQIERGKALFETLYVSAAQYTIRFEPPVGPTANSDQSLAAMKGGA
jgi:uncharacterized protein (DUF2336 family)